ncbi:hypothetical protein EGW08_007515 [Elysia chlorotica]|uniref:G-protein coupled receptors family 1 profile domain-containing protein n=1 Tax=Elysia chlorotica TaxID=188477 RepID=A0A433TT71_ELYCH|nr:hypothetical protein EGW08_007515 [Elysia chlorotica]
MFDTENYTTSIAHQKKLQIPFNISEDYTSSSKEEYLRVSSPSASLVHGEQDFSHGESEIAQTAWSNETESMWSNQTEDMWAKETEGIWANENEHIEYNETESVWSNHTEGMWENGTEFAWSNETEYTWSNETELIWSKEPEDVSSVPSLQVLNLTKPTTHQDLNLTSIITHTPFLERNQSSIPPSPDNFYNFSSVFEQTSSLSHFLGIESTKWDPTIQPNVTDGALLTSVASLSEEFSGTTEKFPYWSHGGVEDGGGGGGGVVSAEEIIKVLVLLLICASGTAGNLMVIWTVLKERNLHRPPFYFLLSLGVTDLSRAVFCLPVMIATVLHGSTWRHGESACELFAFATAFFVFSSALSLLAVAVDRHISLLHPRAYKRRSLGAVNILAAVFIWVIAFSISFPPLVGAGRYVFLPDEVHCAFQHSHYSKNDSLSSAFVMLVILFVTFLLYFRIYRFLRAHRRMRPLTHVPAQSSSWTFVGQGANGQAFINWLNGFGGQAAARQEGQRVVQRLNFGRVVNLSTTRTNKNEHLTRLFLIMTLVFLFSWLPYIVVALVRVFSSPLPLSTSPTKLSFFSSPPSSPSPSLSSGPNGHVSPIWALVSSWLSYAQVALCPFTFFLARGPAGRRRKNFRTDFAMELKETERHKFLLENPIRK